MSHSTQTAHRFTLDKAEAEKWLRRVVAIHRNDFYGDPLPEGTEPARDGEDLPEFDNDWNPAAPDEESTVFSLVNTAVTAGIIGKPDADTDVDFVYADDSDGGYYFFVVYLGWDLKLATRSVEMRKLVYTDETGVEAAMHILDEAVTSANWALTHLDEYVARRAHADTPAPDGGAS